MPGKRISIIVSIIVSIIYTQEMKEVLEHSLLKVQGSQVIGCATVLDIEHGQQKKCAKRVLMITS